MTDGAYSHESRYCQFKTNCDSNCHFDLLIFGLPFILKDVFRVARFRNVFRSGVVLVAGKKLTLAVVQI